MNELMRAIECVADGEEYYGIDIAKLIERVRTSKTLSDNHFTARELEVIKLSCQGYQYKEIGERLGIKFKTVHTIKTNIFHKLGLNNSVDLVLYALRNGIVEL